MVCVEYELVEKKVVSKLAHSERALNSRAEKV